MVSMNRLDTKERAQIIRALVEGNSIRSTVRMTGFAKNTITKLLVDLGRVCSDYQDRALRDLTASRIECDEIWTYVHAKEQHIPEEHRGEFGYGDAWTWVALDPDTKLVATWLVSTRDGDAANAFIADLASRLRNRVQITTDGHRPYLQAIEDAFGSEVDYAVLVKTYGKDPDEPRRFGPPVVLDEARYVVQGSPDPDKISTSYVELQNLTMRMSMRRFTRLTNGFSKKVENLTAAVSLHFMWYNFGRPHQTLGRNVTPAMAAGITDHVWTAEEIAGLLDSN